MPQAFDNATSDARRRRWNPWRGLAIVAYLWALVLHAPAHGQSPQSPAELGVQIEAVVRRAQENLVKCLEPGAPWSRVKLLLDDIMELERIDPAQSEQVSARAALYALALEALGKHSPEQRKAGVSWLVYVGVLASDRARDGEGARRLLERGLALLPGGDSQRVYQSIDLADRCRQWGDLARCEELLSSAAAGLGAMPQDAGEFAFASRNHCAVHTQLALDLGLRDEASAWLVEQKRWASRLTELGQLDLATELAIDLAEANVGIAGFRLDYVVKKVSALVGAEGRYRDVPAARAKLLVRLGMAEAELESLDPTRPTTAVATLEEALSMRELDPGTQRLARETLTDVWLLRRQFDRAQEQLSQLETMLAAPGMQAAAFDESAFVLAVRARISRLQDPRQEVLEENVRLLEQAYEDFLKAWTRAPVRDFGLGVLVFSRRRLFLDELIATQLTLHPGDLGEARAFETATRWEQLGTLARELSAPAASVALVRSTLLPEGSGMLLYFPGDEVTHLFALDADWIEVFALASRYQLDGRISELRRSLQSPPATAPNGSEVPDSAADGAAQALAKELIPSQVRSRLAQWKCTYLVGASSLGEVPFECLPLDGSWLGAKTAIHRLPSAALGVALARRPSKPAAVDDHAPTMLLVAAPTLGGSASNAKGKLVPIQLTPEQVERLTAGFGVEHATVLLKDDASFDGLRQELAHGPSLLHVLTHGKQDPRRSRSAGLQLANGGDLYASDVRRLESVAPMVMLSACEAGSGPTRFGDDGVGTLASAFLGAGAREVVLSRFDVELLATLETAGFVHASVRNGAGLAHAMREARLKLATSHDFRHRFYWGGWESWGVHAGE